MTNGLKNQTRARSVGTAGPGRAWTGFFGPGRARSGCPWPGLTGMGIVSMVGGPGEAKRRTPQASTHVWRRRKTGSNLGRKWVRASRKTDIGPFALAHWAVNFAPTDRDGRRQTKWVAQLQSGDARSVWVARRTPLIRLLCGLASVQPTCRLISIFFIQNIYKKDT